MNQQDEKEQWLGLKEIVPHHWRDDPDLRSVWIRCYTSACVDARELRDGPINLEIAGVRIVFFLGAMRLPAMSFRLARSATGPPQLRAETATCDLSRAPTLLLIAKYETHGGKANEPETRALLNSVAGLLCLTQGENIIYQEEVEKVIVALDGIRLGGESRPLRNPGLVRAPDISPVGLRVLNGCGEALEKLPETERNRILLALRWYALPDDVHGVDGFIRRWIALEVVGMKGTSDIRPLVRTLAQAYGMKYNEARERFGLGRLHGLRSRIVHEGASPPINAMVEDFLDAVFLDVLLEELQMEPEHRAMAVLKKCGGSLNAYLPG